MPVFSVCEDFWSVPVFDPLKAPDLVSSHFEDIHCSGKHCKTSFLLVSPGKLEWEAGSDMDDTEATGFKMSKPLSRDKFIAFVVEYRLNYFNITAFKLVFFAESS